MEFKGYGAGLQNLGNTCYANSVLQVLYAVQPLREALVDYKPATTSDTTSKLVLSAKQLVKVG
jgi:ubiquitin carboxyl-terminal hydrolase 14